MKILQVVPYFPPAYAFGGPVQVAYQVSKELVKRGHEVVVYTTDAKDSDSKLKVEPIEVVDGIKVHYMRNLSMMPIKKSKLFITPKINLQSKEEIKNFDIVHLHEYRTYQNIIIHHYAKKYKVPYVLQAHGSLPRIMVKQRLKWFYDLLLGYRLLRDASKVIALNQTEVQQYKGMGVPEEKIEIIPNGIDLSVYSDLPPRGHFRKKFDIGDNEKIVLYLGRIHRIKGVDILVEAFENIVRELDNIRLVIVGPDDGYLDKIKFLIESKNMKNNVLITGPLYDRDKLEVYVDADVYILPSRYEIFSMTVLEAMGCGTPILLTSNCCLAEFIDGKGGITFEPDPLELQESLVKILTSPELLKTLSKNCKETIKEFDIRNTVKRLEILYQSSIK